MGSSKFRVASRKGGAEEQLKKQKGEGVSAVSLEGRDELPSPGKREPVPLVTWEKKANRRQ